MFYRGDATRAAASASELLKALSKVNASSSSTAPYTDRLISCELNLLLSKGPSIYDGRKVFGIFCSLSAKSIQCDKSTRGTQILLT